MSQEEKKPEIPIVDNEDKKEEQTKQLSKKQLRKQAKKEEKRKMWEENRSEIRKQRKERAKERRKEMKERGEEVPRRKKRNVDEIVKGGNIIIDCDFDDKMNDVETKSLFNQIQLLYGANWKYEHPIEVNCIGISGKMDTYVKKNNQCLNWKLMHWSNEKIEEFVKKDEMKEKNVIYLTAESENELTDVNENDYYIIGGIVDHNKYKRLCENKAKRLNIKTACLPINNEDCIGRKVLTVNQVFEIVGQQLQHHDWKQTLSTVLPQRKQQKKEEKEPVHVPVITDEDDLSI